MIKDVKNTNFVHNSLHFPGKRYTNFYYLLNSSHLTTKRVTIINTISIPSIQFLNHLHPLSKMIILSLNLSKSSHYPVSFSKSFQTLSNFTNPLQIRLKNHDSLSNLSKGFQIMTKFSKSSSIILKLIRHFINLLKKSLHYPKYYKSSLNSYNLTKDLYSSLKSLKKSTSFNQMNVEPIQSNVNGS